MDEVINRAMKHLKCPICNDEISTIKQGESFGKSWTKLKREIDKYNLKILSLGCCFGDERDGAYYCKHCKITFDINMKPIDTIDDCIIMPGGTILREDCMKYELLRKKYPSYKLENVGKCNECKNYKK